MDDPELRSPLLRAVHGRGAFRATKDQLFQHGLADEGYATRDRALERIARDWLASHGLGADAYDPPER